MRTFIAIELPEHIKARIFHFVEGLQEKNLFGGKFIEKDNLHLTLKFLGEVSEEQVENIEKSLQEIKLGKFGCEVGRAGVFDENHIKVIWVDLISDSGILKELRDLIAEKLKDFPDDYKEFQAHITVARVKFVKDRKKLIEEIKKIHFKNLNFEVGEFVLMKSEKMKVGANKYKIIQRFKLV